MTVRGTNLECVYVCPECRLFCSRYPVNGNHGPFVTLVDCECPLDSNDAFHWECWFCGYSQLPSEWTSFAGCPTRPDMPDLFVAETKDLFSELDK